MAQYPMAEELIRAARRLVNTAADIPYVWWQEGDPIPMWWYEYPGVVPPTSWLKKNGIMCSDLINYARLSCGLPSIGGTPAYYDWMLANGALNYDAENPGQAGALIVNPGVWRGGSGQGHIAMYTDERTLVQSTDGAGDFAGVNEGEMDYETDDWWTPWLYGLMPDVNYENVMDEAPEPTPALPGKPRWISIDRKGWMQADGPDWSRGWYGVDENGLLTLWRGPGEA